MPAAPFTGSGTATDPWVLKTPSLGSEILMHRDEDANPPVLVCTVGSTVLHYDLRIIEDLHQMLKEHGDWMPLGNADEQKPAAFMYEARKRGIIFDVGHGAGSFSFDVAEKALAQDVLPGTISSDVHQYNVHGPVYDLDYSIVTLPTETMRFQQVDQSWRQIMQTTLSIHLVTQRCQECSLGDTLSGELHGRALGPESSIVKMVWSETEQHLSEVAAAVLSDPEFVAAAVFRHTRDHQHTANDHANITRHQLIGYITQRGWP